jgi:hypothetical protein
VNECVTPQFYLRGFRDPATDETGGPGVWVADLREGAVELRAPTNAGANVRSYSVPEGSGSRGDDRGLLSKVESATAPVIGKLLGGDLDLTKRELAELLFFAAVLVTRVPPFRDQMEWIERS